MYIQSGIARRRIEILKETPEVSCLFYPEVEDEHNEAVTIEENTLDETAADKWLSKCLRNEEVEIVKANQDSRLAWFRQRNYNIT